MINDKLYQEIKEYCELNNIENINKVEEAPKKRIRIIKND